MKQFKLISLLAVVVMLLGMVAACSPTSSPASQPTAAAQPTTAAVQPTQAAAPSGAGKTFRVGTDATFPPMEFVDASKNLTGFDVELLKAIAADQKFNVEFQNVAWDGIFSGLEAGQYDGIMSSVTVTDDRKKKYDFSEPYFNANQVIVVNADNTDITGPDALKGKRIGTQIQTTGTYAVEKLGMKSKEYDSPDLGLQDMVNGNLDAFVVDTPVAANFALQSEQFKGKLKMVGAIPTNEVYGFAVRKGDPQGLLPLFSAGLADVKKSGEYDKLYEKYIGLKPGASQ